MAQVAEELEEKVNKKRADFLRNFAQLNFLLQVLLATAESQGDVQKVYPLLAEHLDKLDDRLAELLRAWATNTLEEAKPEVVVLFSNLIAQFPLGNKASNMEIAITGYEIALTVYTCDAFPQDWAMTQHNLANAYRERIRGEKAENLELAIAYYQNALKKVIPFSQDWATTHNNLGNAYSNRIKGDKAENLEQAIACFQQARCICIV